MPNNEDLERESDEGGLQPNRGTTHAPTYQANNKGGYGNPPVKSQFKKGGKGGPGRKKADHSLQGAMRKMFGTKVQLAQPGGKSVPMPEALAMRAKKEMLSGSLKGFEIGIKLLEKYGPSEPDNATKLALEDFSLDEANIFNALISRAMKMEPIPPRISVFGRQYDYTMAGDYCVRYRPDGHIELVRLNGSGSDFMI